MLLAAQSVVPTGNLPPRVTNGSSPRRQLGVSQIANEARAPNW